MVRIELTTEQAIELLCANKDNCRRCPYHGKPSKCEAVAERLRMRPINLAQLVERAIGGEPSKLLRVKKYIILNENNEILGLRGYYKPDNPTGEIRLFPSPYEAHRYLDHKGIGDGFKIMPVWATYDWIWEGAEKYGADE